MAITRGIVLAREPFGEADLYVRFLTRDYGLLTVCAKSARKSRRRYVGGLDLFCHDELTFRGSPKERAYLNELTVLNAFVGLRDQLERVLVAGRIAQWVRKLADVSTPMPAVYSLLGQTLAVLERESDPARLELLALVFKLKLLSQLGLKPRMETCVRCDTEGADAGVFDLEAGGVVCNDCSAGRAGERLLLGSDARQFLSLADRVRLTAWSEIRFEDRGHQLSRLVTQFAVFHTQVRLPV